MRYQEILIAIDKIYVRLSNSSQVVEAVYDFCVDHQMVPSFEDFKSMVRHVCKARFIMLPETKTMRQHHNKLVYSCKFVKHTIEGESRGAIERIKFDEKRKELDFEEDDAA